MRSINIFKQLWECSVCGKNLVGQETCHLFQDREYGDHIICDQCMKLIEADRAKIKEETNKAFVGVKEAQETVIEMIKQYKLELIEAQTNLEETHFCQEFWEKQVAEVKSRLYRAKSELYFLTPGLKVTPAENDFAKRLQTAKDFSFVELMKNLGIKEERKSAGRIQYKCPLHEEKTPSFVVYVKQNKAFCFGCQASLSTIDLVMKFQGISFKEALNFLLQ